MQLSRSIEKELITLREKLINRVESVFSDEEVELVKKALDFACERHRGQFRVSGDPYITHPINVALILIDLKMDATTVAAGLLHDILEDTDTTSEELEEVFGREITFLVEGVTKIRQIPLSELDGARELGKMYRQKVETYRKMILSIAEDIRVLVIKLADRLHNIKTLESLPDDKKRRIARETLEIYAPLAHRIGIWKIKWELEDLSFKYLNPSVYSDLARKINEKRRDREKFLGLVEAQLGAELKRRGIEARIISRPKHIYSVYQKMKKKNKKFEELYDLYGIRIITRTKEDVYKVLGVVHELYQPVPDRFKDYVANPKPNFYQSLHTTVVGPDNKFIEIQIRSEMMHEIAEFGIAAHWRYKEGVKSGAETLKLMGWLHNLIERSKNIEDPRIYYRVLKDELKEEDIYVFTPKREIKILKKHSTPIDFAYAVHTELGHRARGAIVNGKLVPLNYELKNGDIVEIKTGSVPSPSLDWLRFVKTSSARQKIKAYFRRQEREQKISKGKEEFMKILKKLLPFDLDYQEVARSILPDLKMRQENNLFIQIAEEKINLKALKRVILIKYASDEIEAGEQQLKEILEQEKVPRETLDRLLPRLVRSFNMHAEEELYYAIYAKRISRRKLVGKVRKFLPQHRYVRQGEKKPLVEVSGIKGMEIKFAKCCIQLPGDEIVGIATTSHVVTIHRKDCPNVVHYRGNRSRILPARWTEDVDFSRRVKVRVVAEDLTGLNKFLLDLSKDKPSMFGKFQVSPNIKGVYGGNFIADLTLNVKTRTQLEELLGHIKSIKGVVKVRPISGAD